MTSAARTVAPPTVAPPTVAWTATDSGSAAPAQASGAAAIVIVIPGRAPEARRLSIDLRRCRRTAA